MIFSNPFTSTVGAAGAIVGLLHVFGVNIPGLDAATVNSILVFVLGLVAKDAATKS